MIKEFTMTVRSSEDGKSIICDTFNNGWNGMEIIGFLESKKRDIFDQINHPEEFVRTGIDENGNRIKVEKKKKSRRKKKDD